MLGHLSPCPVLTSSGAACHRQPGSVGYFYSVKGHFYSFYWILSNVQGENHNPVAGFWATHLGKDWDHGGSRQRYGARSAQGPREPGIQKKMPKGERNISVNTSKEVNPREGELLPYRGVADKQTALQGRRRAAGQREPAWSCWVGEGLCWLRGGLRAAQGAARRGGQSPRPTSLTAAGAGIQVRASPDGAKGIKPLPGPLGLMVPMARGMRGGGLGWDTSISLGILSRCRPRGFSCLLSMAAVGDASGHS